MNYEAIASCMRYWESVIDRETLQPLPLPNTMDIPLQEPPPRALSDRMGRPRKHDPRRVLAAVRCSASSHVSSRIYGVPANLIRHYRSPRGKAALKRLRKAASTLDQPKSRAEAQGRGGQH